MKNRKENNNVFITKNIYQYIFVFVLSIILVCCFTVNIEEPFLRDDNRTQWFPIIERAYSDFFSDGKMPTYNFFQFKGMPIAGQGYYSIMNPLMLFAYLLSHTVFSSFTTITIYITILFSLGNFFFYLLCKECGHNIKTSIIMTLAYSTMSAFFSFHYWYYVFNNYIIIPLLLWVFLKTKDKKIAYISCGIVLAFDMLLGNIQYTCYHYMFFCIICVVHFIFAGKKYIWIMFANIMVGILLSIPFLLLALNCAGDFQFSDFSTMSISKTELVIGAIIPLGLSNKLVETIAVVGNWREAMQRTDYTWLYSGGFIVAFTFLTIYSAAKCVSYLKRSNLDWKGKISFRDFCCLTKNGIKWLWDKKIKRDDNAHILFFSLMCCIIFFVSFIRGGFIAILLSKVPVIKNFRYLFKCLFIIQPLFGVFVVLFLKWTDGRTIKKILIICAAFSGIGLLNNMKTMNISTELFSKDSHIKLSEEKEIGKQMIEMTPQLNKYRFLTLMQTDYAFLPDSFRYYYGFLRNFPTTMGIYAISGYEISANSSHMEQYDLLVNPKSIFSNMVGCGITSDFIDNDAYEVEKQLIDNGIKYIYVQKNPDGYVYPYKTTDAEYINKENLRSKFNQPLQVREFLNKMNNIRIISEKTINDEYMVFEIEGIHSLCSDGIDAIEIESKRMDTITFDTTGAKEYFLSFSYDRNLEAYLSDSNKKYKLTIQNNNGNIIIQNNTNKEGKITLTYSDSLCTMGFVSEIIICLMVLSLFIFTVCKKKKGTTN